MFEPTVIFQRTQAGRDEIYQKKRGLTQSERLVLIMIDGTTSYQGVRSKLPVLTDERFQRALTTLQKKDLMIEVFLPVEGQTPEEVEQAVIDRFIQQDPTDPLTIISFDPEDDFGVFGPAVSVSVDVKSVVSAEHLLHAPAIFPVSSIPETEAASVPEAATNAPPSVGGLMDEALIQQADALAEEVRAHRPQYENPIEHVRDFSVRRRASTDHRSVETHAPTKPAKLHWGYWMIGVGLAFIVGYIVARFTH